VVTPATKCKLRLLKLDCVKDYLLMEEEFVAGQERLKTQEDKNEEDHAIMSSSVGPEYYVNILSFVDKN
jgi:26S proteasome regulatory subunit T2